jgi:hypothetical protein
MARREWGRTCRNQKVSLCAKERIFVYKLDSFVGFIGDEQLHAQECYVDGLLFIFESFAPHFQIKLSTHGSNPNSIFVIMNELELFFLMRILTQNFNIVDLVKILEKSQKLHI